MVTNPSKRGGKRPGAGRPKGSRSKEVIARTAALEMEQANRPRGKKLAKEVLEEFMLVFAGMAATYQPAPPGQADSTHADPEKFVRYAELALQAATQLARYQSPTYRAVVAMTPVAPTEPKLVRDGNVIRIDDPTRASNVYRRMVQAGAAK